MRGRIKGDNLFKTTISSNIVSGAATETTEKSFTVASAPDANFGWAYIDFQDDTKREIIRYHRKSGTTIYYYEYNRENPSLSHDSGDNCQINTVTEFINWLSNNTDDFGLVEQKQNPGLAVLVYGGKYLSNGYTLQTLSDTSVTLPDNSTSYVYLDVIGNTVSSTIVVPTNYIILAKVITAGGDISSIEDYRAYNANVGTGGGSGSSGHTIKDTGRTSDTPVNTYTQRASLALRKFKQRDDAVNLQTVVENDWLGTPDKVESGETRYIDANTQLVIYGGITIDGTLVNDGTLVIL